MNEIEQEPAPEVVLPPTQKKKPKHNPSSLPMFPSRRLPLQAIPAFGNPLGERGAGGVIWWVSRSWHTRCCAPRPA